MLSRVRAQHVLSEFTDFILEDEIRESIVVNVDIEYFKVINYELRKLGYRMLHKSQINNTETFTLVFILENK